MRQLCVALILSLSVIAGGATAQNAPAPAPETSNDEAQAALEAALIQAALRILEQNIRASRRESGEIDKLLRALAGISVADIKRYGICGGPNSEVRRAFGSLC